MPVITVISATLSVISATLSVIPATLSVIPAQAGIQYARYYDYLLRIYTSFRWE